MVIRMCHGEEVPLKGALVDRQVQSDAATQDHKWCWREVTLSVVMLQAGCLDVKTQPSIINSTWTPARLQGRNISQETNSK